MGNFDMYVLEPVKLNALKRRTQKRPIWEGNAVLEGELQQHVLKRPLQHDIIETKQTETNIEVGYAEK